MSAMATNRFSSQNEAIAEAMPLAAMSEDMDMSARLATLRDTVLVLALQLVFRATMVLRRWNY
jgi:hypothetical protein